MTDPEPPSPEAVPRLEEMGCLLAREEMWLEPPPELLRAIVERIAAESRDLR